jgi:type IV secretion system protein VirB8
VFYSPAVAKEKKEVLKLRTWYSNRYQLVLMQKKLLSLFCLLAMVAVVIAIIFVKKFTESKSFEPYVVEMEEKTGLLNIVQNIDSTYLTADEAIKKFYIHSFLTSAEGYNYNTFQQDMRRLLLLSSGDVFRKAMLKHSQKSNTSTINVLGEKRQLTIKIKSIVFLSPTSASTRFVVFCDNPRAPYLAESHYIANIEFAFVNLSLTQEDRFLNPLGFRVTKYNVGEDINF